MSPSPPCRRDAMLSSAGASAALSILLLLLSFPTHAHSSQGLFTYYEESFSPPGSVEFLRIGPASWSELLIPSNQCGGTGQSSGYGQSPIAISKGIEGGCDSDLGGYEFVSGDCRFEDLEFEVRTSGLYAFPRGHGDVGHVGGGGGEGGGHRTLSEGGGAAAASDCSMGRMKLPGSDTYFHARHVRIMTNSEHAVHGRFHPAELQILHEESGGSGRMAVLAAFLETGKRSRAADGTGDREGDEGGGERTGTGGILNATARSGGRRRTEGAGVVDLTNDQDLPYTDNGDHSVLEHYLRGWEADADTHKKFCTKHPDGSGTFGINSLFSSRQVLLTCPAVGHMNTNDLHHRNLGADGSAETHKYEFPEGPIPNIYKTLTPSEFGIYTYRGSLTEPPCTERVHWNVLDRPLKVSVSQLDRIYETVLCFLEESTCRHATVATTVGGTNRPVQPLHGRKVVHRCPDGPNVFVEDPIPPLVHGHAHGHHGHPHIAILFPWFVMTLGIMVYFILSRYCHALPYTAIMFILGTFMGIGITGLESTDQLSTSIRMWNGINSEVLLLTFLPGLIFRDAYCLNIYLLKDAIFQCLIMAFPMVLAGTALLALVGYYILPYGWSFSLCMTFGAILSATDPVAVSALLNEVGAPPRLMMHISGESLLNDGSAIVFFTIFRSMFLFELGIPGLGNDIGVAEGVVLFCRMSLGAVAIGAAFGIGLVRILHTLKRRFQMEEAIVQVMATITFAYLSYYVAEAVCHTSGVLAVVATGVVMKALGDNMINDPVMMEKFWILVEHLLNTLLFALGGVVWGTVISNSDRKREELFTATDWGYLIMVYVLMMVIRGALFTLAYPIIGRIGLKSSPKEVFFISFGGLRGAVGIALAIALDHELRSDTVPGDPRRAYTSQLFGLTGGIALLTLLINGTLCGPILKKLGLADSTDMREKIVARYRDQAKDYLIEELMSLLTNPHFAKADFRIIQKHVPSLRGILTNDIKLAVKRHKANTPVHDYKKPNLSAFETTHGEDVVRELSALARVSSSAMLQGLVQRTTLSGQNLAKTAENFEEENTINEENLKELRKVFIDLLRQAYRGQMERGEIDVRNGLMAFTLQQSLEFAETGVTEGSALCDWELLQMLSYPVTNRAKEVMDMSAREQMKLMRRASTRMSIVNQEKDDPADTAKKSKATTDLYRAIAYIDAHQSAQKQFKEEFCGGRFLSRDERTVLEESRGQVTSAEELVRSIDESMISNIVSHLLSTILLNKLASFIGSLIQRGLLKDQEGEKYMHELVEHDLFVVDKCKKKMHCTVGEEKKMKKRLSLKALKSVRLSKSMRFSKTAKGGSSNSLGKPVDATPASNPNNTGDPEAGTVPPPIAGDAAHNEGVGIVF